LGAIITKNGPREFEKREDGAYWKDSDEKFFHFDSTGTDSNLIEALRKQGHRVELDEERKGTIMTAECPVPPGEDDPASKEWEESQPRVSQPTTTVNPPTAGITNVTKFDPEVGR
jgi:hypothetical protein